MPQPPSQPPPSSSSAPASASDPAFRSKRARLLEVVFDRAVSKTVEKVNYDNFGQCFPAAATGAPETLRAVHEQMIENWRTQSRSEFDKILQERNAIPKLNELDALIEEALEREKNAPRGAEPIAASTLPPLAVITAHIAPKMREANERLTRQIALVGKENESLMDAIEAQEAEMKKLLDQLVAAGDNMEKAVQEVNGAAKGLEQEMEDLGA